MAPSTSPDRLVMHLSGLSQDDAAVMADMAQKQAVKMAPKSSGRAAQTIHPVSGPGFFGIYWTSPYLWFQEAGINPFTMKSLEGKVVPMWIDDHGGVESKKYPKAKTRLDVTGHKQVLIFRRAKGVGKAGRIARREHSVHTTPGRTAGAIAERNVGVKWRHPGIHPRRFMRESLRHTAQAFGFSPGTIRDQHGRIR